MEDKKLEPYSLFFSVGLFSALLGIGLWFFYQQHWINFYPRQPHGNIMFFSFLWAYIAGFLMTAIPKMTRTDAASYAEIFTALILVVLQWMLNLRNQFQLSFYLYGLQILFIAYFFLRRFMVRRQLPFEGFLFFPCALAMAFLGFIRFVLYPDLGFAELYLYSAQAFVLNLVCGLGTRLIPAITRVPAAVSPDFLTEKPRYLEFSIMALLLNSGFLLEGFLNSQIGNAVKLSCLIYMAVKYFKIFKKPATRSFVGYGIRIAILFLIAGFLGLTLNWGNPLAVLHLVYIGGFTLLTLMISTRVTLAHGPQDTSPELHSKSVIATFVFFSFAAIFRFLAGQDISSQVLSLSLVLFALALLIWVYRFFKSLIKI